MAHARHSGLHIETLEHEGYERVAHAVDQASGLESIIAIHDRTLGPALGGSRMWPYGSRDEALTDALRLARGMTFKSALAGLPFGGGKAVIIGDPHSAKSEALLRAYGRFVESFDGAFITGEDVGISVDDVTVMARETSHVVGTAGGSGDPAPMTALGVLHGIRAALKHKFGHADLRDATVAIQGVGHVGMALCEKLHQAGATVVVADVDGEAAARAEACFRANVVEPEAIYDVAAEVLSPCALGGVLNDDTIPRLRCAVVAGAANNQLLEDRHGAELWRHGILYAPDYVINSGGLISVAAELAPGGYDRDAVLARIPEIGPTLARIFALSQSQGRPTSETADELARQRLDARRSA